VPSSCRKRRRQELVVPAGRDETLVKSEDSFSRQVVLNEDFGRVLERIAGAASGELKLEAGGDGAFRVSVRDTDVPSVGVEMK
jgi:hypothetical protein